MLTAAMWVHGHAFSPEHPADGHLVNVEGRPFTDVVGYDRGWGRAFGLAGRAVDREGDRVDTWFHAAIPAPVIAEGRVTYLDRVFLLFSLHRTAGLVGIAKVHLWDGARPLRVILDRPDGYVTHSSGRWDSIVTGSPDSANAWPVRTSARTRPHVEHGLGMSVLVRAYDGARDARVEFHAAGADFDDAETP